MSIDEQTLQKIIVALAAAIDINNDIDQSIVVKLWKKLMAAILVEDWSLGKTVSMVID
jgi:hypothetical protein